LSLLKLAIATLTEPCCAPKIALLLHMSRPMKSISQRIAEELSVSERQVAAAVDLLDAGSTVPFIARYRK
jgi:biotin operon repressor